MSGFVVLSCGALLFFDNVSQNLKGSHYFIREGVHKKADEYVYYVSLCFLEAVFEENMTFFVLRYDGQFLVIMVLLMWVIRIIGMQIMGGKRWADCVIQ